MSRSDLKLFLDNHLRTRKSPREMHNRLFEQQGLSRWQDPSEIFSNQDYIKCLEQCILSESMRREQLERSNLSRGLFLFKETLALENFCSALDSDNQKLEKEMQKELELQAFLKELYNSQKQQFGQIEQRRQDLEKQKKTIENDIEKLRRHIKEESEITQHRSVIQGQSEQHLKQLEKTVDELRGGLAA
ncbi:hypothetical protein RCL1_007237 [Eukaryota sp. TZLM3-RCL]